MKFFLFAPGGGFCILTSHEISTISRGWKTNIWFQKVIALEFFLTILDLAPLILIINFC